MRPSRLIACGMVILLAALLPASLRASEPLQFTDRTLDNGLRVIVVPMHRAPVVSHTLLFYAGAADDPLGDSGVAHYLEHMFFKGTPKVPDGEYARRIEQLGGQYNAFTSADMTGYYVTVAKQHLATVMELEADRMIHLAPPADSYDAERDVILEERRLRTDVSPPALLSEAINAALFRHHPYGRPIIGWAHEMAQLNEAAAMAFFKQYYAPSNAVLMIVGDVTQEEGLSLAQLHYGSWEAVEKPERSWVSEPPRRADHQLTLYHENVTAPRIVRRYAVSSLGSDAQVSVSMALLFAEELLGNARTGMLYRSLVKEQKLATNVQVYYSPFSLGEATLSVVLTPVEGVAPDALVAAYEQSLTEFLEVPIDARAMERTRNQLKASSIFARDSVQGMAFILGQLVMIGLEPEWFNRWEELVASVNEEAIHQAVRQQLLNTRNVTGYLMPQEPKS